MSDCGLTNNAGTFSVSTTAANSVLTESGFEALSYTQVPKMGTHGDTGVTQNGVIYSTWDNPVACKGKGEANAGDPTVEFLDVSSAGMDLMLAYAAVANANSYATKVEWADGSIEYNRGIIMGPTRPKGANQDFKRVIFTLGYNQEPVIVAAP
jgi:hypothetical protein